METVLTKLSDGSSLTGDQVLTKVDQQDGEDNPLSMVLHQELLVS